MPLTYRELLQMEPVKIVNRSGVQERSFPTVSIDSRTIAKGAVFFAIRGETQDGHSFIQEAAPAAGAVVVEESWWEREGRDRIYPDELPVFVVGNTVDALGRLGRAHRKRYVIPVIALTGSSGKTTTKDMIVRVLERRHRVHHTKGNLNNHLGLPITLCGLSESDEISVVEIGMNHPGEIDLLCSICEPTHGLITNIGKGHLGFFGSVDEIAEEKGRLFAWIGANGSRIAFVNADDERVSGQARGLPAQKRYGFTGQQVSVRGRRLPPDGSGCYGLEYVFDGVTGTLRLPVPGKHQTANALAAATVGIAFDVPYEEINSALETFQPPSKRSAVRDMAGVILYDDSYNANPDSMRAALETFSEMAVDGRKILILGDMLELGRFSGEEHGRIGLAVSDFGFDYLFTCGKEAEALQAAACTPFGKHYGDKRELAADVAGILRPGDAVLVKGSRGMRMEEIITEIEKKITD